MTLVVLAAGMGSRYGGMKQIDPITSSGEFIIDFSIYDAIRAGFDKVVFVIKEEMLKDFEETVGKRVSPFIKVEYAFQKMDKFIPEGRLPEGRVKPFGTTHALLCAKHLIKDNFAVINSDDFYGREAFDTIFTFLSAVENGSDTSSVAMVSYVLGNTLTENGSVSRGVCQVSDEGYLLGIQERTKIMHDGDAAAYWVDDEKYPLAYDTLVSMNFWGFTPAILPYFEKNFEEFILSDEGDPMKRECYLPLSVGDAMADGECNVKVYKTDAKWFGVTYSEDKEGVVKGIRNMIEAGIYPDGLWN